MCFIPGTTFNNPTYVLARGLGARNFDRTDFPWVAPASLSPQAPFTADFDGDSDTEVIFVGSADMGLHREPSRSTAGGRRERAE